MKIQTLEPGPAFANDLAAARQLPLFETQGGTKAIKPAVLYCLLVVLLPLLAIPVFIALGASDFFLHHGASVWVQSNDAVFDMKDQHCDLLVYGDSTAMTGIDPEVVERQTGFKTCNISVTNAVLAVTGNMTLNEYLRHNSVPKILIVQLSPDDFQSESLIWKHTIYAEGMLELLRHSSLHESRKLLMTHPREAISFAGYAAGFASYYGIKDVLYRATHIRPMEDQIQVRNGFFTPPSAPRTYCEASSGITNPHSSFARALADDYKELYGKQSAVLVNVAPIPACDSNLAAYTDELDGVTSNSLKPLPISMFNDGRHYTADGALAVSTMLSQQVNEVAWATPGIGSRVSYTTPMASLRALPLHR